MGWSLFSMPIANFLCWKIIAFGKKFGHLQTNETGPFNNSP
jgi:hypothetical protein